MRFVSYRQHRYRRRVNPDTGYINWGESTSTAVPEIDEETYMQAVNNYLAENGITNSNIETWLAYAERLYSDPSMNSKESLITFIERKREYDRNLQIPVETATLPDA